MRRAVTTPRRHATAASVTLLGKGKYVNAAINDRCVGSWWGTRTGRDERNDEDRDERVIDNGPWTYHVKEGEHVAVRSAMARSVAFAIIRPRRRSPGATVRT